MVRAIKAIEIGDAPDLVRLAEEVHASNEARLLRRDGEDLAVLMPARPVAKQRGKRTKTQADYDAFRSAAGGWKDIDTDKLIANIYEDRRRGDRPPIKL